MLVCRYSGMEMRALGGGGHGCGGGCEL